MTRITRWINIVLLFALLVGGLTPTVGAQAALSSTTPTSSSTATLSFENRTRAIIHQVDFEGPQRYTFTNVSPGITKFKMQKGIYKMTYQTACGEKVKGRVTLVTNNTVSTPHCVDVEITFENYTGAPLELRLTGAKVNYTINVPEGKSKYKVYTGRYRYQLTAQCGTKHGKVSFVGARALWILKCKGTK